MEVERNETRRQVYVIDPAWRQIDKPIYESAWKRLLLEAADWGFLGLDMEWSSNSKVDDDGVKAETDANNNSKRGKKTLSRRPYNQGRVAVVQLSTSSVTFVIRISDLFFMADSNVANHFVPVANADLFWLLSTITNNLRSLLADDSVAKIGVGINGDKQKLQRDYPSFSLSFCVELESLARRLFPSNEKLNRLLSLKDFAARFAGTTLEKDILVTCSDWGGRLGALSPLQVRYAAGDAEASFDACAGMLREARVGGEARRALLRSAVTSEASRELRSRWSVDDRRFTKRLRECAGRRYDNIIVYDKNMRPVFVVDKAKAECYVHKKGIARIIEWSYTGGEKDLEAQKGIAAIQLDFVPKIPEYTNAQVQPNFDYARQPKKICCVVCGDNNKLCCFFVVPISYRRYFPLVYMIHQSYDVLLLCKKCFAVSQEIYFEETARILSEHGIPLGHLKGKKLELFSKQLQQEISFLALVDSNNVKNTEGTILDGASDSLPSAEKLRNREEYLEIEIHRDIILKIFTYAKQLQAAQKYHTAAHENESTNNGTETNNTDSIAKNSKERLNMRDIPENIMADFADYIRAHAPKYPFAQNESLQEKMFAADAASPISLRCILEEGASFRVVLTRFWLREHPETKELIDHKTRWDGYCGYEELLELSDFVGDKEDNFVDSPGFIVVWSVMRKYSGHPSKSSDHAIGEFIYRWRKVFLEGMQPKHLPSGWSAEGGIIF